MAPLAGDVVPIPCRGCSKQVMVPAARARAAARDDEDLVVFCSQRCNVHYVAKEGARQQQEAIAKEASRA